MRRACFQIEMYVQVKPARRMSNASRPSKDFFAESTLAWSIDFRTFYDRLLASRQDVAMLLEKDFRCVCLPICSGK